MTISGQIKVLGVLKYQCCRTCKADGDYAAKFQLKNEAGKLYDFQFRISGRNGRVLF